MRHKIKPMLATLVSEPFDHKDWIFEPKWDGYRAVANINHEVELYSRNLLKFNNFQVINQALKKIPVECVLDGEVVVEDGRGRVHFQLLQNYQTTGKGKLVYYVFDLLYLKNHDLRKLPLLERKKLLNKLLSKISRTYIRYSPYVEEKGKKFFQAAAKKGWEGIIAKQKDSIYLSGQRTRLWLKIKTHLRQEVVIAGYTAPTGGRKYLGSLLLAVYEKGKLKFIGHTGSGFDDKSLKFLHDKLKSLITNKSAFEEIPKSRTKVTWVKPKLIAEISFAEWTSEGIVRQAIFHGLRTDKNAKDIKREIPK